MARKIITGEFIGNGFFGDVFDATIIEEDGVERGDLAIKKLRAEHLNDEESVGRFKREVRILYEMDHANVMKVEARNISAVPPWFIMPKAEESLRDILVANGAIGEDIAIEVFTKMLRGVAYAHAFSGTIVHRDLKPENVLFVEGEPVICDFGLGMRMDPKFTALTKVGSPLGTFHYLAPEQYTNNNNVGPQADVFALGKILGEMLIGELPDGGVPDVSVYPERFRAYIGRCAAKDPADRYANGSDALAAFEALVGMDGVRPSVSGDLQEHLASWELAPASAAKKNIEGDIANWLIDHQDDEEVLTTAFPKLPRSMVDALMASQPEKFDRILHTYDDHIDGGQVFDYCDVIADFYKVVYSNPNVTVGQKRLVLSRLLKLGPSHSRWHVGDVVADLLAQTHPADLDIATSELAAIPSHYRHWLKPYIDSRNVNPAIKTACAEE